MTTNICLIANPVAGRGRGRSAAEAARAALAAAGADVKVQFTRGAGEARELAAEMAGQYARIGAVGGDGTLSEVAAGLVDAGTPMGLIPAGTGNDLCRSLGIPRDPAVAARLLLEGEPRPIDLWRANDRSFLNAAGIGLDADVAYYVNQGGRLRGMPAYLAALVRALRAFRPLALTIHGDGRRFEGSVMLAALANAPCYGGGIPIAPGAAPDDGLLDVVVVQSMSRLALALQFPRLLRGAHLTHPRVTAFRAAAVQIDGDPAARISLDGELGVRLPLTVTRHPRPVMVVTGRRG